MAIEALQIIMQVEIIDKTEFITVVLNANNKIFRVHIIVLVEEIIMPIHLFHKAYVALLRSMEIPAKYSNFSEVFFSGSMVKLLKHTGINYHSTNTLDDKQLPYGLIYCLKLMNLKILKTYIKANLAGNFIKLFKFSAGTLILFV